MRRRKGKGGARVPPTGSSTVAMGFVTGLLSGLTAKGADPSKLLEKSGIGRDQLHDAKARVALSSYVLLYNLVVAERDDEGFGLFSQPLRGGTFEFLTRSVLTSSTLDEALQRASRFFRLILPEMQLKVSRQSGMAKIEIRESSKRWRQKDDPRRVFAFEWLLRLIHGLSCWLIDRSIHLDSVVFPFARPAHAADYGAIYTAHANFSGSVLVASIAADVLDAPIRRTEADLAAFLDGAPGRISTLYRRDRETFRRVRDIISITEEHALSLGAFADQLHLSKRTLQRRLSQEGLSLRSIKEAMRRQDAFFKLERTRAPIGQIAIDLGFADTASFYRAFKQWASVGPRQYRESVVRKGTPR